MSDVRSNRWYAIPPYRNEGWRIFNESGELVATFEDRNDCERAVNLYNQEQEKHRSYEEMLKLTEMEIAGR